MILVIGATGQLGTAVIRRLIAAGQPVRAFVRRGSRHEHFRGSDIKLAYGDLREADTVDAACRGARAVIATANAIVPEGPSSFEAVEGRGYATLIEACQRHRVDRFIFVSTPSTPHDDAVPAFRYKRLNERRLQASGLSYTVLRASLIMDDWFAFIGGAGASEGAEAATVHRRYWFLQAFMRAVGGLIDKRGIALIPGSRRVQHAFITLDDVAEFLVACTN
jgi:NADH dehydrogenase